MCRYQELMTFPMRMRTSGFSSRNIVQVKDPRYVKGHIHRAMHGSNISLFIFNLRQFYDRTIIYSRFSTHYLKL